MIVLVVLAPMPFTMPAAADMASEAAQAWSAAKETTSTTVLESFIRRYPDTFYADLARARLEELRQVKKPTQASPIGPSSEKAVLGDPAPTAQTNIPDRSGQSPTEQVAAESQRAVLYVENPSDPKGDQYIGSVVWHSEPNWSSGKIDIGVRADVEIPDRKLKATLSFHRNADPSVPASHIFRVTVQFQDATVPHVANVPGMLMKTDEPARGTPLAALAVKVGEDLFVVGLSNSEADRQRNIELIKQRSWLDMPMIFTNQRRAILVLEKGSTGTQIFNDVFAAWQQ
jgi:hypothetical protein